jgi:hypothetical protein
MNDDLISRDELYENMLYAMCGTGYQSVALREIELMPSVDAVPVIRCKDCKWFGKAGCAVNIVDESDEPKENDYCSWAERKEK